MSEKHKQQGMVIARAVGNAIVDQIKEVPVIKQINEVFIEPVRGSLEEIWQIERTHRQAAFIERVFDGAPNPEDVQRLADSDEATTFAELFKHASLEDESVKGKIYGETCKVLVAGKVSEHYRRDFIRAVKDLSFKDLDFLVAFVECLPKAMKLLQPNLEKYSKEEAMKRREEAVGRYLDSRISQADASTVNRLLAVGALSTSTGWGSKTNANHFGRALVEHLRDVVVEVGEEVVDAYHQKHKHRPLNRYEPRTGKSWVEEAPADGWTREELKRSARPWLNHFRQYYEVKEAVLAQ